MGGMTESRLLCERRSRGGENELARIGQRAAYTKHRTFGCTQRIAAAHEHV